MEYSDYRITQRVKENFRPATCAEVECSAFRNGWKTIVPAGVADQVRVVARDTGRAYIEQRSAAGLVEFSFQPGQEGFKGGEHDHTIRVDSIQRFAKQRFVKQQGVQHATGAPQPLSAQSWVDDFGENQERLAAEQRKG